MHHWIELYLCAYLSADIRVDGYNPTRFAALELYAGSDFADVSLCGSSFFVTTPLHAPLDSSAMGIVQGFILRSTFCVSEVTEGTCP